MGIYLDLIKKVHPDHNPHLTNAHQITCELNAHRNNERVLMEIGIRYGLIPKPAGYTEAPKEAPKTDFVAGVGVVVAVHTMNRRKRGVMFGIIVAERTINKGKWTGLKEFTCVSPHTGKVFTTMEGGHMKALKMADTPLMVKAREIAIKECAIPMKVTRTDFFDKNLSPNYEYVVNFPNTTVMYKGITHQVIKTTRMYVYILNKNTAKLSKVYPQALDGDAVVGS